MQKKKIRVTHPDAQLSALDLKQLAYLAGWLDERLPSAGWTSLDELHVNAVLGINLQIPLIQFAEVCHGLGLGIKRHESGKGFDVSRTPNGKPRAARHVGRNELRRSFEPWLERRVHPGEYYPREALFDEFRREFDLVGYSSVEMTRSLQGTKFAVEPRYVDGRMIRCVVRRAQDPAPRLITRGDAAQAGVCGEIV